MNEFKSIHIDLDNNVFEVNGESIKELPIISLNLIFDGCWQLTFTQKQTGIENKQK